MEKNNSNFKGLIPPELIDSILTNNCVLFIGSGISSRVKRNDGKPLPNWKTMLHELLQWSIHKNINFFGETNDIKEMIDDDKLITAAQELQECVGANNISEFINSIFHSNFIKPNDEHKMICEIPFSAILTTNYDNLIEGAYSLVHDGRLPPVFTQADIMDRINYIKEKNFFIFKLHGHIDRPDTLILGNRDYNELLFRDISYRQFIETLFAVKNMLFIGYSFNDPDLKFIIDKLSTVFSRTLDFHYILLPETYYNFTEKRRLLIDKRLKVIEYKDDEDHEQVKEFIRELRNQVRRTEKDGSEIETVTSIIVNQVKNDDDKYIFLSGSHHDNEILRRIKDILEKSNIKIWFSETEIEPGAVIVQQIADAIKSSIIVLFVITENSKKSSWINSEIQAALFRYMENKIKLLPIIVGNNTEIPKPLTMFQCLLFNELDDDVIKKRIVPVVTKMISVE